MKDNDSWVAVKYCHNRGIIFDGDLPHLATEVTYIPSNTCNNFNKTDDYDDNDDNAMNNAINNELECCRPHKRVILGFNCFTDIVSECCMRAPEHSDAFNRTIKLYQTLNQLTSAGNSIVNDKSVDNASSIVELSTDSQSHVQSDYPQLYTEKSTDQSNSIDNTHDDTSNLNVDHNIKSNTGRTKNAITAEDILKNKALGRMLVIAARKLKLNSSVS